MWTCRFKKSKSWIPPFGNSSESSSQSCRQGAACPDTFLHTASKTSPSQQFLDTECELPETAPMRIQSGYLLRFLSLCLACGPALCAANAQPQEAVEYLVRSGLRGARGGNLVTSIPSDPASFNRMFVSSLANAMVAEQLSADLVHINRLTYELEPSLATRWEVAADGRSYTIHLRKGVRFSDGSPFTADDVVFTLDALRDPKTVSTMADQIQVDGRFPAVSRMDPHTVRFAWPRPVGTGLRALDSIPILPRHRLWEARQAGNLAAAWGPATPPGEIAGLGPFRLKQYQRGTRIVLERNPYFWKKDTAGRTLPYLDTLTFLIIPDRNAEALRFQAGEIDLLNTMSPELFISLRRPGYASQITLRDLGPGLGMDFLWFNLNPGKSASGTPFLDPEKRAVFEKADFRQAVSSALDREGMVKAILRGLGTPQYGPISSGNRIWFHPGLKSAPYDQERARGLLARVGLRDGNGDGILEFAPARRPMEIILLTARGIPARENAAEIIRQNLAQVGIRLNVQLLPVNELVPRFLRTFDYEAILFGNTPSDVVPDLQADLWYSSGVQHFWHPGQAKPYTVWEEEMDTLTTRLLQSLDAMVRITAFFRMQEIWAEQLPAIPTMAPNILSGWRNNLGNIRPSLMPFYLLWNSEEITKPMR